MKVTIITVVYNGEKYIADAIRSVLSQTYPAIEYIVVDGSSTDSTVDIVRSFGEKVDVLISEKDHGLYDAMNKGIRRAGGDIIALLNSDDIYADERVIEDVVREFDRSGADAIYGNLEYVKAENTHSAVRYWQSGPMSDRFFDKGNVPPHPALFLRSDVYRRIGLFNTELTVASDYELMLRAFKVHRISAQHYNRTLVKMRLGGTSNSSLRNIVRGNREILRAWRMNGLRVPALLAIVRLFKKLRQFVTRGSQEA